MTPTALIVDDEPDLRSLVGETLQRHGFSVIEAAGIEDATTAAREHRGPIELLVVDHCLKDGVGQDAVTVILEARPQKKVLRYSGYPREHLLEAGCLAPGDAFLQKPFLPSEFVAKVADLLGAMPERRRASAP